MRCRHIFPHRHKSTRDRIHWWHLLLTQFVISGFGQCAWHLVIVGNGPMPKVCHKCRSSYTIANLNQVEDSKLIRIHVTEADLVTLYKIFDTFNVKNDDIIFRSMHLESFISTLNCVFLKIHHCINQRLVTFIVLLGQLCDCNCSPFYEYWEF